MPKPRAPSVKTAAAPNQNEIGPRGLRAFALILCATLVAYLPALEGSLLWDDSNYVTQPELRSLHGLWRIWSGLGLAATNQYYPLLHSAFWFEHDNLGNILFNLPAQRAEATAHFQAAVRADPDYWEAHLSLAAIWQTHSRGCRAGCRMRSLSIKLRYA